LREYERFFCTCTTHYAQHDPRQPPRGGSLAALSWFVQCFVAFFMLSIALKIITSAASTKLMVIIFFCALLLLCKKVSATHVLKALKNNPPRPFFSKKGSEASSDVFLHVSDGYNYIYIISVAIAERSEVEKK